MKKVYILGTRLINTAWFGNLTLVKAMVLRPELEPGSR